MQALRNGHLDILVRLGQEGKSFAFPHLTHYSPFYLLGQEVWDSVMGSWRDENALHVASMIGRHDLFDYIFNQYHRTFSVR